MQDCRYIHLIWSFSTSHPTVALVDTSILFILWVANADVPSTVLLWVDLLLTVAACKTIWDDVWWEMADEKGIPHPIHICFSALGNKIWAKGHVIVDGIEWGMGSGSGSRSGTGSESFALGVSTFYRAPILLHELLWSMQYIYFSDETELLPVDFWQESFENLRFSNFLSRKKFLFQAIHSVP